MTELKYLTDSYLQTLPAKVLLIRKKGQIWEIALDQTIFYPRGGGQPADKGKIVGQNGILWVNHVRTNDRHVLHEGKLTGKIDKNETVTCYLDWQNRWKHMQYHSAGHLLHEVVKQLIPDLVPIEANHGQKAYIVYQGQINPKLHSTIEKQVNMLVAADIEFKTELITYSEIIKRNIPIFGKLPKNKPLRILTINSYPPIPDGGTQVSRSGEIDPIKIEQIQNSGNTATIYYSVNVKPIAKVAITKNSAPHKSTINLDNFKALILELEEEISVKLKMANGENREQIYVKYFGPNGTATQIIKKIADLPIHQRKSAGLLINSFKAALKNQFSATTNQPEKTATDFFDISLPGVPPPSGSLHLVTQAINEITRIFEKIGFTRLRHPEVDWDYYAFTALNMPENHPARDEWETFHIKTPSLNKNKHMVLTPHTSNAQVREMEKGKLPIKIINIAKCYRRQMDISHTPMFHQFEGLYIDRLVSISHLKGVCDYFFKSFYGPDRISRLRPFHFQFTEPSFEIDVRCGICQGKGILPNGAPCKLCKAGWLELGGAGMVHPNVLKNGGIDPNKYSGFAFGWRVERTFMMKSGLQIDDIRLIYENDLRILKQF